MFVRRTMSCCGVGEISGLSDHGGGIDAIRRIIRDRDWNDNKYPFYFFADALGNRQGGTLLASTIKKHKLGVLMPTTTRINPNSDNKIKAWLWIPDKGALKDFKKKHGLGNREEEDDDY